MVTLQIMPDSIPCRLYVLVVLVETTINLAIECDMYLRIRDSQGDHQSSSVEEVASRRMPVYLAVFAGAQLVIFHLSFEKASGFPPQCLSVCYGCGCSLRAQYIAVHLPNVRHSANHLSAP